VAPELHAFAARKNVIHPICACTPLSRKVAIFLNLQAESVIQPGVGWLWGGAFCENTRPFAPGEVVIVCGLPLIQGQSKSVVSLMSRGGGDEPKVRIKSRIPSIPEEKLETPISATAAEPDWPVVVARTAEMIAFSVSIGRVANM
jgi:hypothetical protein